MNENKLYLVPNQVSNKRGNYLEYTLCTANRDEDDYSEFYPFAVDVMLGLMKGYDCLGTLYYTLLREPKKHCLRKDTPAKFLEGGYPDLLINYIKENDLNWKYCTKEFWNKTYGTKRYGKVLAVLCENISSLFISKIDMNSDNKTDKDCYFSGINLAGYSDENNNIDVLTDSFLLLDYDIYFEMEEFQTYIDVSFNPLKYPLDKLMKIINNVALKHNKFLEVKV